MRTPSPSQGLQVAMTIPSNIDKLHLWNVIVRRKVHNSYPMLSRQASGRPSRGVPAPAWICFERHLSMPVIPGLESLIHTPYLTSFALTQSPHTVDNGCSPLWNRWPALIIELFHHRVPVRAVAFTRITTCSALHNHASSTRSTKLHCVHL